MQLPVKGAEEQDVREGIRERFREDRPRKKIAAGVRATALDWGEMLLTVVLHNGKQQIFSKYINKNNSWNIQKSTHSRVSIIIW